MRCRRYVLTALIECLDEPCLAFWGESVCDGATLVDLAGEVGLEVGARLCSEVGTVVNGDSTDADGDENANHEGTSSIADVATSDVHAVSTSESAEDCLEVWRSHCDSLCPIDHVRLFAIVV